MKRHLTIEHSVHLVMICFALASLGNVSAFLTGAGHPWYSAWLLAVALAVGLTSLSIMLTGVDRQADPVTFWTITVAASALGILSGSLQSAEYARHLGAVWSVFLGFTSPLAGEVALAFAASLYGKAHKRARFASIGADLENGVADVMIDAMASVDRAAIQRRVDRVLNQMAGLAIDSAAQKAMALYVKPVQIEQATGQKTVQIEEQITLDAPSNTPNLVVLDTKPSQTIGQPTALERANEQRKQAKLDAQRIVLNAYQTNPDASLRDVAALVERSPQTVSNWLKELEAQRLVTVNGSVHVHGEL